MAVVQLRNQTPGRAYYDTRKAGGVPSMMAMHAPTRRLSNVVFARMLADQKPREAADPGGQPGTTTCSSVTDLTPDVGSSEKPRPGPVTQSRTVMTFIQVEQPDRRIDARTAWRPQVTALFPARSSTDPGGRMVLDDCEGEGHRSGRSAARSLRSAWPGDPFRSAEQRDALAIGRMISLYGS
jgi:hypothetical protein